MKTQTPAQRVANPVWLRAQIQALVQACDDNIKEDEDLAHQARTDPTRDEYLARAEAQRHWRRQLRRILRGKTFAEVVDEALQDDVDP